MALFFFVGFGCAGPLAAPAPRELPLVAPVYFTTRTVVLPVLPLPGPTPSGGEKIELPPPPTPRPSDTSGEGLKVERSALLARFVAVLWQRARVPVFIFILAIVFLAFFVWSLRSRGPLRWRSLTARSLILSAIIHLMLLISFDSLVLSQRVLQTIRDPEFEVLLNSDNLVEEKISLGIREETVPVPLANASAALAVAPKEAEVPLPPAAIAQQPPEIVPARVDTTAFQTPPEIAAPTPGVERGPQAPRAARPSSDFKILLTPADLETPRPSSSPDRAESSTATVAPQKTDKPLAALPAITSGPLGLGAAAKAPAIGPLAPLTDSLIALPAPQGAPGGVPIEAAIPPRILVPRPSPRPVPPPFVLEERPVSEATYKLREPEQRAKVLEKLGGTSETEETVRLALAWLAAHQSDDGRWDIALFDAGCGQCGGQGAYGKQNVAATALAVLAFLGANHSHQTPGPYRDNVARAIKWLVAQLRENGNLFGQGNMYDQGMGTIALAEACAMTRDPSLRVAAARAAQFIAAAQNRATGGWRYFPGEDGDTSVFGWQVMALKSAALAGAPISPDALKLSRRWLDRVGGGQYGGLCGYQSKSPTSAMVAEGMFARQLLGHSPAEPMMLEAADYLRKHLPAVSDSNVYYWYYGTLALFQHQGPAWQEWNAAMRKVLLSTQEQTGTRKGSWAPAGQWGKEGGRVIETAMAALSLEVYYRYLPMYAPLPAVATPGLTESKKAVTKAGASSKPTPRASGKTSKTSSPKKPSDARNKTAARK